MFGFGGGRQFQNDIAKALGVEGNLIGTCLLEVGIGWPQLKGMKKAGVTPHAALHVLAPSLRRAIRQLEQRFGNQPELRQLEVALTSLGPKPEEDRPIVQRLNGREIVSGAMSQDRAHDILRNIPGRIEGAYALILCHDLGTSYVDPSALAEATNIPEVNCGVIFERLAIAGHLEVLEEDSGACIYRLSPMGRPIAIELKRLHETGRLK